MAQNAAASQSVQGNQRTVQQYEYNARGQIVGIVDGNRNPISYDVDSWGRITGVGFADGVREGYEYTPSGQISRAIDGNGNSVQYRYNSLGKVRERIDQAGYSETYRYDGEGNLILHIDRDGRQVHRTYNVFGDMVYEKATDANGENPNIITCQYDSLGRLTRAVCDGHSYEYAYNAQGFLQEKRTGGKRLISYEYNDIGQLIGMKDPAGIMTCYEYDLLGRQIRIYNDGLEVRYGYDALNRISHIRYGNGVETFYAYDGSGNLSSLETRAGSETLLSFTYQYDGNGNRVSKTGIQSSLTSGNNALDISYQYNVRGQLLEERRNGASVCYAYDAAGNRIRQESPEGETSYRYNEKNQLIYLTDRRGEKAFTYNKQGSIVKENADNIIQFGYNSKNQQVCVEHSDGRVQENYYDAEGLRHEVRENGKLLQFVYHDGELLQEEGGDNSRTSYHQGQGIEAFRRDGKNYYYHRDEQSSTAFITDQAGKILNCYRYDAFGNEPETTEQLPNRIRYTGQQYDSLTEQYYLRARYYNPLAGRFMQEDVYQGDGLNLYAYCDNNPVTYYDPSGYSASSSNGMNPYNQPRIGGDGSEGGSGTTGTNGPDLYHYTDAEGARAIQESGMIKADDRGRVFVTTDEISPQNANNALFMGTRNDDCATHRVDITLMDPNDNNLTSNGATQPNELIYNGTLRNGRNAILDVKENDF